MATVTPDLFAAVPDPRYAPGVRTGTAAELLGLGRSGLRLPQVIVIGVGLLVSGNTWVLTQLELAGQIIDLRFIALAVVTPVFFLTAAITAVRSSQSAFGAAALAGAIYAALATALRIALIQFDGQSEPADLPLLARQAGFSFLWLFLTMLALQYAVLGERRWVRLGLGLFAASLIGTLVGNGVMNGFWSLGALDPAWLSNTVVSDLLLTAAFWLGHTLFGRS